ncbi:MAG TPA: hypothetical protein VK168_10105 [Saprospiraceae bacterium]|nr:hypothetical protein [Saprospiraceae bacterium]
MRYLIVMLIGLCLSACAERDLFYQASMPYIPVLPKEGSLEVDLLAATPGAVSLQAGYRAKGHIVLGLNAQQIIGPEQVLERFLHRNRFFEYGQGLTWRVKGGMMSLLGWAGRGVFSEAHEETDRWNLSFTKAKLQWGYGMRYKDLELKLGYHLGRVHYDFARVDVVKSDIVNEIRDLQRKPTQWFHGVAVNGGIGLESCYVGMYLTYEDPFSSFEATYSLFSPIQMGVGISLMLQTKRQKAPEKEP